ncbi:unnamed protein product [Paramecium octaurelia]|uniref:Uncharacterized protein n=1 Tax=Paramecium octaurelia TaxID=43137 RepID=A0A8S1WDS4_PAROT|nr:unnamed protein product [Paramecium octaurelia]
MINKSIQPNRNMVILKNKKQRKLMKSNQKTSIYSKNQQLFQWKKFKELFRNNYQMFNYQQIKQSKLNDIKQKTFDLKQNKQTKIIVSKESIPLQQGKEKKIEFGNRVTINLLTRMSTIQIEEEAKQQSPKFNSNKDPETFTDWVENIYGKQWFAQTTNQ